MTVHTKATIICDGPFGFDSDDAAGFTDSLVCLRQTQIEVLVVNGVPKFPSGWSQARWVRGVLQYPRGHPDYEKQQLLQKNRVVHSCPDCTDKRRAHKVKKPALSAASTKLLLGCEELD